MYFKPNPKAQVELKFIELFGNKRDYKLTGWRPTPSECSLHGLPNGVYVVELFSDGKNIARASHRDWRAAYRLLQREVEKLYSEGFDLVQST